MTKYIGIQLIRAADGKVRHVQVGYSGGGEQAISVQDYLDRNVMPPLDTLRCQHGLAYESDGTMAPVETLKPCPFCGSTDIQEDDTAEYIACYGCGASGPSKTETLSPSTRWNARYAG